jgi:hypothetical protein
MTEDMNKMTDTTTTDQPPATNGHATNGVTHGESLQGAAAKDAPRKTKAQRKAEKKAAAAAAAAANTSNTPAPETAVSPENPPTMEASPAPAPAPAPAASTEAPAAPPVETTAAAPIEVPIERLRLRMKIWTHPKTGKRYLMTNAYMRDVRNGQPISDVMVAHAMCEDDTMNVTLRVDQWQALPFFYVQEDGPAPRPTKRPR